MSEAVCQNCRYVRKIEGEPRPHILKEGLYTPTYWLCTFQLPPWAHRGVSKDVSPLVDTCSFYKHPNAQ